MLVNTAAEVFDYGRTHEVSRRLKAINLPMLCLLVLASPAKLASVAIGLNHSEDLLPPAHKQNPTSNNPENQQEPSSQRDTMTYQYPETPLMEPGDCARVNATLADWTAAKIQAFGAATLLNAHQDQELNTTMLLIVGDQLSAQMCPSLDLVRPTIHRLCEALEARESSQTILPLVWTANRLLATAFDQSRQVFNAIVEFERRLAHGMDYHAWDGIAFTIAAEHVEEDGDWLSEGRQCASPEPIDNETSSESTAESFVTARPFNSPEPDVERINTYLENWNAAPLERELSPAMPPVPDYGFTLPENFGLARPGLENSGTDMREELELVPGLENVNSNTDIDEHPIMPAVPDFGFKLSDVIPELEPKPSDNFDLMVWSHTSSVQQSLTVAEYDLMAWSHTSSVQQSLTVAERRGRGPKAIKVPPNDPSWW